MIVTSRLLAALIVMHALAAGAAAQVNPAKVQDRQFVFSISTLPSDTAHATVNIDSGSGASPFDVTDTDRPEHRVGVQALLARRLTFVGRVGVASDERDMRTSQQAELLVNIMESPSRRASIAVGGGMRHESMGTNVLLGRIAAGRSFSEWRLDGNAVFEKPFSGRRDAVDLITSVGVSRRLQSAVYAGVECIGQDLEGFWETEEAEGGARVLVGPSVRIAPPNKNWQVVVAGGPLLRATRSDRSSDAIRGLQTTDSGRQYAVRTLMSYGF